MLGKRGGTCGRTEYRQSHNGVTGREKFQSRKEEGGSTDQLNGAQ